MTGPLEITGVARLGIGLFTGILFGIFLDKGRLTKYDTIVGQFLLKDFTMLKIMMSALIVGSIGIYALSSANMVNLHITPVVPGKLLVGSALFGLGMAIFGY
jgi:hypothetical protein